MARVMNTQAERDAQAAWVRRWPGCPGCGRGRYRCVAWCWIDVERMQATEDDRQWFRDHPRATERVRPYTLAEQVGAFFNSGYALGTHVRIEWRGRWWPTKPGERAERMLSSYEVE